MACAIILNVNASILLPLMWIPQLSMAVGMSICPAILNDAPPIQIVRIVMGRDAMSEWRDR
jgi:hypothetical protein